LKSFFIFSILIFFLSFQIMAQEKNDLLGKDLDSIFDESFTGNTESDPTDESTTVNVNKSGITFGVSYEFKGGLAPGWNLAPWHFDGTEDFSWEYGAKMVSKLSINAQISEVFKVYTSIDFKIPNFSLALGDFFFDYNFYNRIFVRAGKYEHTWGISSFANLLARVPEPEKGPSGPSYIMKADIPIGVGGFQFLALTRVDIAGNDTPKQWSDLAFGGKYNAALRWVDLDVGVFYQRYVMPTRGFLSIKTTLGKTEVFNEWLVAVNTHTDNAVSFAANIGFLRNFFNDKLTLGGEVFYNGEENTYLFKPETIYKEAETVRFLEHYIIGFNFLYRISGKGSPRLFTSVNYSVAENSAQLIPGFKFTPFKHIEVYCAVPMALGNKEGYYYTHNADLQNRPFSIMLLVTLTGSVYTSAFN